MDRAACRDGKVESKLSRSSYQNHQPGPATMASGMKTDHIDVKTLEGYALDHLEEPKWLRLRTCRFQECCYRVMEAEAEANGMCGRCGKRSGGWQRKRPTRTEVLRFGIASFAPRARRGWRSWGQGIIGTNRLFLRYTV